MNILYILRELYGTPIQPLEFELDDGPAIEMLLSAYPLAVAVQGLPHSTEELEDKVAVAQALYKEGYLLIDDAVTANATRTKRGIHGDDHTNDNETDDYD